MLTQFLFRLSARSGSVLRQLGDSARASVRAQVRRVARGSCVRWWFGWTRSG